MDAKSTFLQSSDTDSIEDHETDQGTLLFITFLRKLNLFKYDWIPLAGVLSRRGPQQCTRPVGTREQVNLSNNTLLEKTTDPVDEAAETELLVSCEKKAGANREKLPDVVCEASSFMNTTAMSSQKADKKHCLKRTVSFQESSTRPALTKAQNFDEGGGDTGCATATARRRARSSGYYTGNSRDSDVGAPNDAEDDVFPSHRDERSSSRDEVCEDGEHPASEDVESVRISSDSSTSSFMISPSAEFPDFSALGVEEEAPGVGEWEPPQVGQLQPQGLGHLQPPGVQQFLRAEEFVETVLGSSDPDPVLADDDALMATYGRELQEEKIRRMMWQGVSLETMEEDITNQLPAEIDLSPANTGPVNQPTENPSASSVDQDICHRLQMAAQCDLPECDFLPCIQGQQELTAVTMYLETLQAVPSCVEIEKQKLRYLLDHATSCEDELRCTVPWCHFIFVFSLEHGIELDRLEQCLHEKYYTGHRDVFSHSTEQCDLIQLQHDVPHQRPSYEVLARLAPYKDVFLVIDLITSLTSRPAYFVIKQLSPVSSLDEQEELLRRLRHPHIVTHHWLLKPLRNTVFICTQFHGDSVRDWLRRSHPNGCGSTRHIWTILTQVLSAVEYLHSLSILYLAWTGSDVVLGSACDDTIDAKLSDFSHAVSMGGELSKEHEECLRQQLLPAIVPPEETLSLTHSDQWGVGCLLYEIALGYKVHRAYVHDGPERQRQQIGETRMPDLTDLDRVDPAVASVVISCLQSQVENRPTIECLQQLLPHI